MDTEELRRRRALQLRAQKRRKERKIRMFSYIGIAIIALVFGVALGFQLAKLKKEGKPEQAFAEASTKRVEEGPDFMVQLLTPNPYSRPQTALERIDGIVIHYTANPGTSAQQNRDYFEGLKDSQATSVSSHFVVGLEGEIIQCIPSSEIAYASNERNEDTLSIEVCHPDDTGEFTKESYDALVHLTAWLCGKFDLAVGNVIRHYDVKGKPCPLYYVEHEDAWRQFLLDVEHYIEKYGVEK